MEEDLKPGDYFDGEALVETIEQKRKRNGDPYTVLGIRTKAGKSMSAKYWQGALGGIAPGKVIHLRADVDEWQERIELKVKEVSEPKGNSTPLDFLPRSKFDPNERYKELLSIVEDRCKGEVKETVEYLLKKFEGEFKVAPAAVKMHHARLGGLVEHTLSVTRFAVNSLVTAAELGYDTKGISYSVLAGGAVLHDIGKTREYRYSTTIDFDPDGSTVGHLAMGHHMFISAIKKLKIPYTQDLKHVGHIILSHHGKLEWGAPVEPMTIEALLVHRSDLMSRDLDIGLEILAETRANSQWTERDRRLWNSTKKLRVFSSI
ncbi:MAG: HD domain-containing protein [Deltaproteobacteria bacterium]|nr:HD domain-containing protein [Deltaproteobacteria bacterium]